jgi:hypothetical protein
MVVVNLEDRNLNDNEILVLLDEEIEKKGINNITELLIYDNNLYKIPDIVNKMKRLRKISASNNQIKTLENLTGTRSLEVLDLTNNDIDNLPLNMSVIFPKLHHLTILGNPIKNNDLAHSNKNSKNLFTFNPKIEEENFTFENPFVLSNTSLNDEDIPKLKKNKIAGKRKRKTTRDFKKKRKTKTKKNKTR